MAKSGLVLATDVAALDPEIAVGADADEDAGIGHDGRISVSGGPLVEGFEQRLDFPAPTLSGGRHDLVLLNVAMNRLSGILVESEAANPLDVWRASRGSRSA